VTEALKNIFYLAEFIGLERKKLLLRAIHTVEDGLTVIEKTGQFFWQAISKG
jgi:hypothetical protein